MAEGWGRIRLEVVTPERQVLSVEVDEVSAPGALGYFGVLPGHTPFITTLGRASSATALAINGSI